MTDNVAKQPAAGWVCYDADCALCRRWLRRVERPLLRHGFNFVPLQAPWIKARLNLADHDPLAEMRLLRPDQEVLGGADAAVVLMQYVWWLWPLWLFSRIPGTMPIFRAAYRHIAANRHCANGSCLPPGGTARAVCSGATPLPADDAGQFVPPAITRAEFAQRENCHHQKQAPLLVKTMLNRWLDWLPLPLLLIATLSFRDHLPNWVFMWLFVTAMFVGCKWLTWRRGQTNLETSTRRTLGYLFAWPGMDAKSFLTGRQNQQPPLSEWLLATGRFLAGIALLWLAAHAAFTTNSIANAWLGMFGLTLLLHFGSFHLVALAWQRAGVPAKPLMQSPTTATSLAAFWGVRWNTAFNKLVHDLAFRPLARRLGIAWATMGVFAISGVIHELAISFPARGGYGLPLGYFILQGCGVLIERSRFGQALGLGHGFRGWLFMFIFTATPAYWLFHPTFVQNVILPMLQTISAT